MKVLFSRDKTQLYHIMHDCFRAKHIQPKILEIGVLNGHNADYMHQLFNPSHMMLIDAWTAFSSQHNEWAEHRPYMNKIQTMSKYFGGDPRQQSTFDVLYHKTCSLFQNKENIHIVKENSIKAHKQAEDFVKNVGAFNFIYIDGNHYFENVFDDLMLYHPYLSHYGAIQLNDVGYSFSTMRQNIGVLEAIVRFIKATDFVPIIMTNSDHCDLILTRKTSPVVKHVGILAATRFDFVEIPNQILGNMQTVFSPIKKSRSNLSFK